MIAALMAASIFLSPTQVPDPYPVTRSVQPMAISFEQFFRAIVSQESGGNYGAVGVMTSYGRAYGKYQVLESNIGPWTSAYYGKSLTAQQFLNNHAAQDAVARGKLKSYWDKYGARGAAAAWYGGPGSAKNHMSTARQQGGPSIKGYVDSVLAKAEGESGGDLGGSDNGGGGGGTTPVLDAQELAEQYGFANSFLNSIPELKTLFSDAVSGGWSKDKFQAKMRDTKWFKSTSADERKYLLEMSADPATAQQRWDNMSLKVRQLANKLGIQENSYTWNAIHEATRGMIYKGWDEGAVRNYLGGYIDLGNVNVQEGEAGEAYDAMHQYAYSMGVELSSEWYSTKARNIVRGLATIQDFKSEIAGLAKANFPQWTKQIEGGQTVADIAQPYLQSMANILELPPGSVNLFDNTIKKALSYTNSSTMEKQAKPLWQFENELRGDPRWKKTKNAQDSLMQVGHKVLADFGVVY